MSDGVGASDNVVCDYVFVFDSEQALYFGHCERVGRRKGVEGKRARDVLIRGNVSPEK